MDTVGSILDIDKVSFVHRINKPRIAKSFP
jgi:hypothetical protein